MQLKITFVRRGFLTAALTGALTFWTVSVSDAGSWSGERGLEYRVLEQGENASLRTDEPAVRVFRDPVKFRSFYRMVCAVRIDGSPPEESEAVNYEREIVVFFSFGEKRTGGYGIEVVDVRQRKDTAVIRALLLEPPQDSFQIQALTHPYAIVVITGEDLSRVEILNDGERAAEAVIR